jgi:NADH:ubiquinone oxidoreductase subunit 6 (subunit J)
LRFAAGSATSTSRPRGAAPRFSAIDAVVALVALAAVFLAVGMLFPRWAAILVFLGAVAWFVPYRSHRGGPSFE